MTFEKSFIPYGGYWSSPYSKWQGSFANLHGLELAANTARKFFELKQIDAKKFDNMYLGMTVPQTQCFYGGPWTAAMLGGERITGPVVNQACITGIVCTKFAAQDVDAGISETSLVVAADRCSNGPHLYYPSQTAPGATGKSEDWVLDNFGHDPWAKNAMIQTAENVAKEHGVTREQNDEVAARRYEQYQDALADDGAFHKKYMVPVTVGRGKRAKDIVTDEGVFPTTLDGLKTLKPVMPDGTLTFGSQTHPADGNSGMIVTTKDLAKELSANPAIEIQILGFGTAREKKGYMAAATIPATRAALADVGLRAEDINVIKTHNPFAVNDIVLAKELGFDLMNMNNYGSSMIWGHPQGPTALRTLIELIEELAIKGGGYGLFAGCAAGDTAGALVIKVTR
ncbi:MAG: thiolase family protein [Deltaproteobacteria bacterium]|nr:thiolase family protein [Deltaproteobacteria bacterium]